MIRVCLPSVDGWIYFYSQAISQEEAVEEVNFVIQNLEPYRAQVRYPIAFDMEFVANDAADVSSHNPLPQLLRSQS